MYKCGHWSCFDKKFMLILGKLETFGHWFHIERTSILIHFWFSFKLSSWVSANFSIVSIKMPVYPLMIVFGPFGGVFLWTSLTLKHSFSGVQLFVSAEISFGGKFIRTSIAFEWLFCEVLFHMPDQFRLQFHRSSANIAILHLITSFIVTLQIILCSKFSVAIFALEWLGSSMPTPMNVQWALHSESPRTNITTEAFDAMETTTMTLQIARWACRRFAHITLENTSRYGFYGF